MKVTNKKISDAQRTVAALLDLRSKSKTELTQMVEEGIISENSAINVHMHNCGFLNKIHLDDPNLIIIEAKEEE